MLTDYNLLTPLHVPRKDILLTLHPPQVPIPISAINDTAHIVKVGISDAYSEEDGVHTFIPFDVIDLDTSLIASDTSYVLTPIPSTSVVSVL